MDSLFNSVHLFLFYNVKDSSSVVEWTQRPHRPLDQQLSCETEWDMINTVSFKRKVHTNGEGTAFPCTYLMPDASSYCVVVVGQE